MSDISQPHLYDHVCLAIWRRHVWSDIIKPSNSFN